MTKHTKNLFYTIEYQSKPLNQCKCVPNKIPKHVIKHVNQSVVLI